MKTPTYFFAATALAAALFAATQPAYASGATVMNTTQNRVMVEEFNGRGTPSGKFFLRPGAQGNVRAGVAQIVVDMFLPGHSPPAQCGPMRRAAGTLRVVAVGRHGCRIQ